MRREGGLGLWGALSLGIATGCSSPDFVVLDERGRPVVDARVVGMGLSLTWPAATDDDGQVFFPWLSGVHWLSVSKEGFMSIEGEFVLGRARPLLICLEKSRGD